MSTDQIIATFLCVWYGFSAGHHVHSQTLQDEILNSEFGNKGWWRLALARFIFFVTGMLSVLGFFFLYMATPKFEGPPFTVGVVIGVAFYILSVKVNKKIRPW